MNVLNKYGITFYRQENGSLKIDAPHPYLDLAILLNRFTIHRSTIPELINIIDLTLDGKYNEALETEKVEWHEDLGTDIYTGIIQSDFTFDIFMEDPGNGFPPTPVTLPLLDIREILESLLSFMQTNFWSY